MKQIKLLALGMISALVFTACTTDEPDNPEPVEIATGAFVLNQGVMSANLPGTLTYCDYFSGTAVADIFSVANGTVLGDTPQDALSYGNKLYIAVYQSNLIRVLDRTTLKVIKDIRPTVGKGTQPRYLAADGGKVYVSMYDGYAARIDTLSLAIEASVKVGPNPDGVAVSNGFLYVANSDGMNYLNGFADGKTVSKIDLKTFTETQKIEVGLNPGPVVATEGKVFVVTRGNYFDVPAELKEIRADGTISVIGNASLVSAAEGMVYYFDATYGADPITTINRYEVSTGSKAQIHIDTVEFPAALGVDPLGGYIIISAYNQSNGYADYTGNGYALCISPAGRTLGRYEVGVNPCAITFNSTTVVVSE